MVPMTLNPGNPQYEAKKKIMPMELLELWISTDFNSLNMITFVSAIRFFLFNGDLNAYG